MTKPTLYLMVGYPGAGKTTTAREIAKLTGAIHIWADQERRHKYIEPKFDHQENLDLYRELNVKAHQLLEQGKSVVYDTNFNFAKDRQRLSEMAKAEDANCVVVWVTTSKDLAKQRAVHDEQKDTRILGSMTDESFERISSNLEEPTASENVVKLDGTKITDDYVAKQLGL